MVDGKGIPQEFRCTEPVRPTLTQTALYGTAIKSFISFDLCGQALLESLTTGPVACLVESEVDLNLQEHTPIPVLHARRSASHEGLGAGKVTSDDYNQLDSPANFLPISLKCSEDWDASLEGLLPDLQQLFGSIDLVEPFERITASCQLLCEQDTRFK